MSVNDESAATRQFVAASGAVESRVKQTSLIATGWLAAFIALFFVVHGGTAIVIAVLLLLLGLGWAAFDFRRWRRKIVITATNDGLTVNLRRGDVFSVDEAALGIWLTKGVALHLRSGSRDFVLGGRDRRISAATRLDAPPVQTVDAWLWDHDFDELLAVSGGQRGPGPGESTRCLLYTDPAVAGEVSSFAIRKHIQIKKDTWRPQLAIDISKDAVRVIDPDSNTDEASASLAQVTAAPVTFHTDSGSEAPTWATTTTGLIVRVPGLDPLRIGCRDAIRMDRRFWWRADAPVDGGRAAYVVSGGDWLTLVDTFGLSPLLEKREQAT